MPLPIPLINGQPGDIDEMTVEQLKNFITFAYSSHYAKKLPDIDSTEEPPTWWTKAIVFDKTLKLTSGYRMRWQRKYLVELLYNFYHFFRCTSLLKISSDLCVINTNGISNGVGLHLEGVGNVSKLRSPGNVLIAGGHSTRTYALNTQDERKEITCSRETQVADSWDRETDSCPNEIHKRAHSQHLTHKNWSSVSASDGAKLDCNHDDLMSVLGLSGVSKVKSVGRNSFALRNERPPPASQVGRTLRKLPSRIPFLSIIAENPFLPITSGPGLHLLSKLGGKIEEKDIVHPPPYESYCQAIPGERMRDRRMSKKAVYPVDTDPSILKDGRNPHIYSYGRGKLQRTIRNQELVVGLSQRCWPTLKKCKNVRLHLKTIHPATKNVQISDNSSYLMRAFRGATLQSRIQLVDFIKYPDSATMPFINKLLEKVSVPKRRRNKTSRTR